MKNKMIKELALDKNMCFNQMSQTDEQMNITKSKKSFGSRTEIKEICNIESILEKYKQFFDIKLSLEEVVIKFKQKEN